MKIIKKSQEKKMYNIVEIIWIYVILIISYINLIKNVIQWLPSVVVD